MQVYNDELYHYGVKGMHWGVIRNNPVSKGIAKYKNYKVDRSFKKWKKSDAARDSAINYGKLKNEALMEYEHNGSKESRAKYKQAEKNYKKSLRKNTTYRKGVVKKEVGSDLSRKYLSAANSIKKNKDFNSNSKLKKEYKYYMSQHEVERSKARKATAVAQKRSTKKANIKRAITMSIKGAITVGAMAAGAKVINNGLNKKGVGVNIDGADLNRMIKAGKDILGFMY